ncbi:alpha/beta fold hydrolase [Tistrella mobilis]|uniref:bifunctional alpha/beta hydrolase/OsmC family protein n=1 Tax=Tistrella mobilis TaxID=171437 RepID=UPI0035572BB8
MASPPLRPEIAGRDGRPLPVLVDLPEGGAVTAGWAIFAHCFTCSAASTAATRIARGLAAEGLGVLRVDFTGSGEGCEPPAPDFAADVEDIILAAGWLERSHAAPVLLIGHSLGGTAVLAAAPRLAAVRAVATIGAPSAPEHILHHLGRAADGALEDGRAVLPLGSGTITVTRDFVQGVRETDVLRGLGRLHKALLVMHAPLDQTVGIDEATRIFVAARHPKSFVSLDTADHLLNGAADASYAAGVIAAWAAHYTRDDRAGRRHGAGAGAPDAAAVDAATAAGAPPPEGRVVVAENGRGKLGNTVRVGRHIQLADEPVAVGGQDGGPAPYDYLLAGLGACTSMTIRMYADRKGWPLTRVTVTLAHAKVHARDCAECETREGKIDVIDREILLDGPLDDDQRAKLMEIADKCPVHRTLHSEILVRTRAVTA